MLDGCGRKVGISPSVRVARGAMYLLVQGLVSSLDVEMFLKSIVGSVVMALVVLALQLFWPGKYVLPLYVFVGGLVYLGMLRVLRAVREEDLGLVRLILPGWMGWLVGLGRRILL